MYVYTGYHRFFLACDGELRFVGRRPKKRAAKPREKTSGTQGNACPVCWDNLLPICKARMYGIIGKIFYFKPFLWN